MTSSEETNPSTEKQTGSLKWAFGFLLFSLLVYAGVQVSRTVEFREFSSFSEPVSLSPEELQAVASSFKGDGEFEFPAGGILKETRGPVVLRLRRQGRVLVEAWEDKGTWYENLESLLRSIPGDDFFGASNAEIEFCHSFEELSWEDEERLKKLALEGGVHGVEMIYGSDALRRFSPNELCVKSLTLENARFRFLRSQGQDPRATVRQEFKARLFRSVAVLVAINENPQAIPIFRANRILEVEQNEADVIRLRELLAQALIREIESVGRLPYLYVVLTDEVSYQRELVVRQSLAVWALARLARLNSEHSASCEKAVKAMLRYYYSTDGEFGFVTPPALRDQSAIGEIALLGMALLEGPLRGRFPAIEASLLATTDAQWQEDGSFFSKIGDNDPKRGIDFYPGETLLFWSKLYQLNPDPSRLEKMMKSFHYYRDYHLNDTRQSAFVPWQTQAWVNVWEETKDPELAEFVFEMNDWLLQMCRWDDAPLPDLKGAFWDPSRPKQGALAHVSSTGVYLEGLAAAYRLAKALGDEEHMASYEQAIRRGIFSLRQHQYEGLDDLYFAANPDRTRGHLRGQLYVQNVRIDNNSHALLALLALSECFEAEHYHIESSAE